MAETSIFTLAVHAGERAAQLDFTPVATPIYHAASYLYEEPETLDAVFAGTRPGPSALRTLSGITRIVSWGFDGAGRRWPTSCTAFTFRSRTA